MRCLRELVVALLVATAASKKKQQDPDGYERMSVELDGSSRPASPPPQSPEMKAKEAKAIAGLDQEYKDALQDIMAVLLHGADQSKDDALHSLVQLAVATSEDGTEQARIFRSAVVAGGALPAIIDALGGATDSKRTYIATAAIHALALDDPTTDDDNFHAAEICEHGAVGPLVKLLDAQDGRTQAAATSALAALAENPTCQSMITAAGAVAPLVNMATYAPDMLKLGALGALDVLSVNSREVRQQLASEGAPKMLEGLATMGSGLLREEAGTFGARLKETLPDKPLSPEAHVKAARQTRMRYDGVRQRAFKRMQGWGEQGESDQGE